MSRRIAFGGIFTALSFMMLYFAALAPTGRAVLYFLSGLPVALAIVEIGIRTGVGVYFATSLLALFFVGNVAAILPYVLFFGHYGILKFYIEKRRHMAAEILMKLAAFNLSAVMGYLALRLLMPVTLPELSYNVFFIAGVWIASQMLFFVYDYIYSELLSYYENRIRKDRI